MSTPIVPGDVNSRFVNSFIDRQATLNLYGDPGRVTTQEHRGAIEDLDKMYAQAMQDGGLNTGDRTDLAKMMNHTELARIDGFIDNFSAEGDPGYYEPGDGYKDIKADTSSTTERTETASTSEEAQTQTKSGEPRRAADGRIIFDAAPSLEDVKNGDATIGIGQKGEQINDIQQQLFDGGHYKDLYPEGTAAGDIVDGMNGDKTTGAIKAWQKANGYEETGSLDKDGYANLMGTSSTTSSSSTTSTDGTKKTEGSDGWWASPEADGLSGAGIDGNVFKQNKADIFAGTTEDTNITDSRGRIIADGATNRGIGVEYNATGIDVAANIGDSKGTGADGRLAIEADVYAGAEVSTKLTEDSAAISGKVGAYAGVDSVAEGGLGFRYFGFGGKATAGVGAGAVAEGHASYENGRASAGFFTKAGKGVTAGGGMDAWIDFGQMKDDLVSAKDWAVGLFSGVDTSRN